MNAITDFSTQQHPVVTSGLIMWSYGIDPDDDDAVSDAITDAYRKSYDAWCARKEVEARTRAAVGPKFRTRRTGGGHTPCPVTWAGR
jgi:hypothetical protein